MESTTKIRPPPSTLIITRDFYKQPFPPAGSICGNYLRARQIFHAIILPLLRGSWYAVDLHVVYTVNLRTRTRTFIGNEPRNSTIMRRTRTRYDSLFETTLHSFVSPLFCVESEGRNERPSIKFQTRIIRICSP